MHATGSLAQTGGCHDGFRSTPFRSSIVSRCRLEAICILDHDFIIVGGRTLKTGDRSQATRSTGHAAEPKIRLCFIQPDDATAFALSYYCQSDVLAFQGPGAAHLGSRQRNCNMPLSIREKTPWRRRGHRTALECSFSRIAATRETWHARSSISADGLAGYTGGVRRGVQCFGCGLPQTDRLHVIGGGRCQHLENGPPVG